MSCIEIVQYVVDQGIRAIIDNTDLTTYEVDYVAIFCRDESEFIQLRDEVMTLGDEVDKEMIGTGNTYKLHIPIQTRAGLLSLVKIRKPDPTRPQRGAPDFRILDYQSFKEQYLMRSGNFTLMSRKEYEMVELKGIDVLVYIPNKPLSYRMKTLSEG